MAVTRDQIVTWLEKTAVVLDNNKQYLTDLDAAIGDADHGINMSRGFAKVMEKCEASPAHPRRSTGRRPHHAKAFAIRRFDR